MTDGVAEALYEWEINLLRKVALLVGDSTGLVVPKGDFLPWVKLNKKAKDKYRRVAEKLVTALAPGPCDVRTVVAELRHLADATREDTDDTKRSAYLLGQLSAFQVAADLIEARLLGGKGEK